MLLSDSVLAFEIRLSEVKLKQKMLKEAVWFFKMQVKATTEKRGIEIGKREREGKELEER